jgi:hypothetical protein
MHKVDNLASIMYYYYYYFFQPNFLSYFFFSFLLFVFFFLFFFFVKKKKPFHLPESIPDYPFTTQTTPLSLSLSLSQSLSHHQYIYIFKLQQPHHLYQSVHNNQIPYLTHTCSNQAPICIMLNLERSTTQESECARSLRVMRFRSEHEWRRDDGGSVVRRLVATIIFELWNEQIPLRTNFLFFSLYTMQDLWWGDLQMY